MTDKPINLVKYDDWNTVPPNLKTRTALKQMGLRPKRGAKVAALKASWYRGRQTNTYDLYDVADCEPYTVSDAQRAAIGRAQEASLKARTCTSCGWVQELGQHHRHKWYIQDGLCPPCRERDERKADRIAAAVWAKRMLDGLVDGTIEPQEIVILDSETTDLYGEIIDLAIINLHGDVLYDSRFKTKQEIAPGAQAVHGLSAEMLAGEPVFADEYPAIRAVLEAARLVLIYNAEYDVTCLRKTCTLHGCEPVAFEAECLMLWYAQFVNEWNHRRGSYRWQKLGGEHNALGDCRAALATLKEMAAGVEENTDV